MSNGKPARPARRPRDPWRSGEPRLADVMNDPIIHLVMARDNLLPADVWPVINAARRAMGARLCPVTLPLAA